MNACFSPFRRFLLLFLFACALPQTGLFGQFFGGTPNRISWVQIETDTVRVVYPEGMDYWGRRVANLGLYLAQNHDSSLFETPVKTTIIIRNLTTRPNGFVAFAPYRSELFSTPPYNMFNGVSPWVDMLTIHEYRHIEQFSKIMYKRKRWPEHLLFGEAGWAAISYLVLPDWYFEGDATKAETMYSLSGRGRLPEFYLQFPALRSMGKRYNFEKTRAGSYKDFVPNRYNLGYHLTCRLEEEFGAAAWNDIVTKSVRRYALISHRIKKTTGLNNRTLYAKAMVNMDKAFPDSIVFEDPAIQTYDPKNFTQYALPKIYGENGFIYLKNSFRTIPAFYLFDGEKEKMLFEPGFQFNENWFDLKNGRLIWAEYRPDVAWQNEDFSVLVVYDINSGRPHYLPNRTSKWFYPKWSRNGQNIGALQTLENGKQDLLLLDTEGHVLKKIPVEEEAFISAIASVDEKAFIVVYNRDETARIMRIDMETGTREPLGAALHAVIRHPVVSGGYVYYSTVAGISEQIVRVSIKTGRTELITKAPFRAVDPVVKGDTLVYVSDEGIGYTIRYRSISEPAPFVPGKPVMAFYPRLEENSRSILKDIPDKTFGTKPYKKVKGFYIHSWAPWMLGRNFGLSLFMQNRLGTFKSDITYLYNTNENASQFSAGITWEQFYPKLTLHASHTLGRHNFNIAEANTGIFSSRPWTESKAGLLVALPFYLTRGKWSRKFTFRGSGNYMKARLSESDTDKPDLVFGYWGANAVFYNLRRQSKRQIFPRWGQTLTADARQSFENGIARQYYLTSVFYFPGVAKTHSFYIAPSYKYEPLEEYYFLDGYPATAGYTRYNAKHSFRITGRYSLPLVYPDFGIPGFLFFRRIYTTLFYDYSKFYNLPTTNGDTLDELLQRSFGIDINFDITLFRIFPIRLGFRTVYRQDVHNDNPPVKIEFLLYSISI